MGQEIANVLHIANGDLLNRKLADKQGRITRLAEEKDLTDQQAIDQLYLVTYSRRPTADELHECQQIIARAPDSREGLEDILWTLLNTREFLFNH